jgi:hypothetical protein
VARQFLNCPASQGGFTLAERAIADPEWIEGTAISMGSAVGGFANCAMMQWCR